MHLREFLGCPRGPTLCYSATFAAHSQQTQPPLVTDPLLELTYVPLRVHPKKDAWTGSGSRGEGWETSLVRKGGKLSVLKQPEWGALCYKTGRCRGI